MCPCAWRIASEAVKRLPKRAARSELSAATASLERRPWRWRTESWVTVLSLWFEARRLVAMAHYGQRRGLHEPHREGGRIVAEARMFESSSKPYRSSSSRRRRRVTEIAHRTVEANGIPIHLAEAGKRAARPVLPRLSRILVFVAPSAEGAGRGRLSRRRAGHARLWPDGPARRHRPVHAVPPRRRHGRRARRAERARGRHRRPRLGRAGRLALRASSARPLSRRRGLQRAVPSARVRRGRRA